MVMDYYENGSGAVAKLNYHQVDEQGDESPYHAEYWNITDGVLPPHIPTGPADLVRDDDTLDFDWSDGSPGAGIGSNMFVARWTKTVKLSAGVYRFSGVRDDGIRAYIDNVPVVDRWTTGHENYSVDKVVTGGEHQLRVEYFEAGGGAQAEFTYERIGDVVPGDGGYAAEYFANRDLAGTPALTRTDDAIDFDWGSGPASDSLPANNFSARWTKTINLADPSAYKFTVSSDDGVRLFIDGVKVLDSGTSRAGRPSPLTASCRRARTRSCSSTSRRMATPLRSSATSRPRSRRHHCRPRVTRGPPSTSATAISAAPRF